MRRQLAVCSVLAVLGAAGVARAQTPTPIAPVTPTDSFITPAQLGSTDNLFGPLNKWELELNGGSATLFVTSFGDVVNVDRVDATDWHVLFERKHLSLVAGQKYLVHFKARAAAPHHFNIQAGLDTGDFHTIGLEKQFDVTTDWQTYDVVFVATTPTPGESKISMIIGQQVGRIDFAEMYMAPYGTTALADAAVAPGPPPVPGAVVPFGNWDLLTGGTAQAFATPTPGGAEIEIDHSDGNPADVILKQDAIALDDGKTYDLEFAAKSTIARQIRVVAQNGDHSAGLDETVRLRPNWETYHVKFTAAQPAPSGTRIAFMLGASASTIDFFDVSLNTPSP